MLYSVAVQLTFNSQLSTFNFFHYLSAQLNT
nr:MAG TPA: hypothetical protein [Caudoviricetes sp.]